MILYIDHYDSFVNTILDYVEYLDFDVCVKRTDEQLGNLSQYTHVIIGPGPGNPNKLKHLYPIISFCEVTNTPLLGICLGHQLIAQYYKCDIVKAKLIFHGKNSIIFIENNSVLYKNLSKQFSVTRYHSLIVKSIKEPLIAIASTEDNEIMAFEHNKNNIFGMQYHPEAYLTECGLENLNNFLKINRA